MLERTFQSYFRLSKFGTYIYFKDLSVVTNNYLYTGKVVDTSDVIRDCPCITSVRICTVRIPVDIQSRYSLDSRKASVRLRVLIPPRYLSFQPFSSHEKLLKLYNLLCLFKIFGEQFGKNDFYKTVITRKLLGIFCLLFPPCPCFS